MSRSSHAPVEQDRGDQRADKENGTRYRQIGTRRSIGHNEDQKEDLASDKKASANSFQAGMTPPPSAPSDGLPQHAGHQKQRHDQQNKDLPQNADRQCGSELGVNVEARVQTVLPRTLGVYPVAISWRG